MRDLKADLELCNRASGESWKQASDTGYPYTIMDETFENVMAVYCTGDDAQFIAQAREGWPHAIERALEAEAETLKYKEAHRHVLDILNVVSDIVVETKDRSENDTSQYADGQYDLCDTISKSIAWKIAAIESQSSIKKLAKDKEV